MLSHRYTSTFQQTNHQIVFAVVFQPDTYNEDIDVVLYESVVSCANSFRRGASFASERKFGNTYRILEYVCLTIRFANNLTVT